MVCVVSIQSDFFPVGYSTKFYMGTVRFERVQPLTLLKTIFLTAKVPLSHVFYRQWYPIHIPSLEICILFLYDSIYRVSQKFVPLISCTITFDQNFIFTWNFQKMFISLLSTRVQNFSNWHALLFFFYHIL